VFALEKSGAALILHRIYRPGTHKKLTKAQAKKALQRWKIQTDDELGKAASAHTGTMIFIRQQCHQSMPETSSLPAAAAYRNERG
jgi:hypothetical protein